MIEQSTPKLKVDPNTQLVTVDKSIPTISVLWNQVTQQAVINTAPGPTIASRAYGMVHTAMFDAWAAYDPKAIATQLGDDLQRPENEITENNKEEAMSFAAYCVLKDLFPSQIPIFDKLMLELGFDPNNVATDITTAVGVGNVSAQALLELRDEDGSNENGKDSKGILGVPYSDISNYQPINPYSNPIDIEYWTPELVPIDAEPGKENTIQNFLTPHWGNVIPFALESGSQFRPQAPEPFLLVDGEVDLAAKTITLEESGEVFPITKDLIGDIINPKFIEQTEKIVDISGNLTDKEKLIAEFWEDGDGTSFPPGTWMTFGEFVSARDSNTLDEDAQLFFALGNAVFDAGIATWESKTFYDYVRPVRAVRTLGELGLIGEFDEDLGGFAIDAWKIPGAGTQKILATDFITYQTPGSHPSPPFAEYTSGHSAFSAAGAEILQLFTDSDEFGASVTFNPGESRFEVDITPSEVVTLAWDTFTEAADEAGMSRIYGGIHFDDGDINGRQLGIEVGQTVWEQAQYFIQGGKQKPEILIGSIDDDFITGLAGSDTIDALAGSDTIRGKEGDDLIFAGEDNDLVLGEFGNDTIFGNEGDDCILGNQNNDLIVGGEGNDILDGNLDSDTIFGNEGSDILIGGLGDDFLEGGSGSDRVTGGEGNDTIIGVDLTSTQSLLGKGERDILVANRRFNSIGSDTFILGNETSVFYNDGNSNTKGETDLARILGFDPKNDTIQLHGSADLYSLKFGSEDGKTNARIIYQPESEVVGELIASIIDVSPDLSLENPAFSF